MPFRDAQTHFRDILDAVALVDEFVGAMDFEAYQADPKTKAAVERELQIITEAAYRLTPEDEALCPGPNWVAYKGMGNILRHGYHKVDDEIVWNTVKDDLPKLKRPFFRRWRLILQNPDRPHRVHYHTLGSGGRTRRFLPNHRHSSLPHPYAEWTGGDEDASSDLNPGTNVAREAPSALP